MMMLRGVTKTYRTDQRTTPVLCGIDLEIKKGEYAAIMGSSGSGKSTLLNILGLLDRPSSGHVVVEDRDVTSRTDRELSAMRNRQIGFVFQLFHLLDRLTAEENVLLPLLYSQPYPSDDRARAGALLRRVGLGDRASYRPGALSGGEQQRVAIARALINTPSLLLADEPTGNLDSASGAGIMALFKEINAEGRTIVLVTHDPVVARQASRVLTMRDGQLVTDGGQKLASEGP